MRAVEVFILGIPEMTERMNAQIPAFSVHLRVECRKGRQTPLSDFGSRFRPDVLADEKSSCELGFPDKLLGMSATRGGQSEPGLLQGSALFGSSWTSFNLFSDCFRTPFGLYTLPLCEPMCTVTNSGIAVMLRRKPNIRHWTPPLILTSPMLLYVLRRL